MPPLRPVCVVYVPQCEYTIFAEYYIQYLGNNIYRCCRQQGLICKAVHIAPPLFLFMGISVSQRTTANDRVVYRFLRLSQMYAAVMSRAARASCPMRMSVRCHHVRVVDAVGVVVVTVLASEYAVSREV